ncbi:uncharacterized protein LOC108624522 [Ceratina calcarata]|uniref:Uncharacterized protein LOC108624522 n=1 Tax=Ceratina calcarata TaxID=156304 RepID=A0AAJ7IXL4_9HYME|nr:uncharacterized protein LOC108624522 [Ceratina calcarata]
MDIIVKTILNYKCNRTRTLFQRLYKRSYYTSKSNYSIFNNEFRGCPGRYFLSSNRHKSSAVNEPCRQNIEKCEITIPEHKIIHSYLQNSKYYDNTIMSPIRATATVTSEEIEELYNKQWHNQSVQDIMNDMKKLTYCHLCGSRFEKSLVDSILQALTPKLSELDSDQIKTLMQHLVALKDVIERDYISRRFFKALDKECIKHFFKSNVQEMLLIVDAFYQLQRHESDYLWRAIRKLGSKYYKLSGKELVQLLFVINIPIGPLEINMFEIECRLEDCIEDLTGDEIGIIARGFFLQKRSIRNRNLMSAMLKKLTTCLNHMDSSNVASVMKILRYSETLYCMLEIQQLLKALHPEIPRVSLRCLTHIMHALGGIRIYDEELINSILDRVINEMKQARLKDIERIIYGICAVTPFTNYYTDVCHRLINEIMMSYKTYRMHEINTYQVCFVRILSFLTIKNLYVPELIQFAFEPSFVQKTYKSNLRLLTNEYLILHCSIKIELPYYTGPLLSEKLYEYLTKKFSYYDDVYRKDNNVKLRTEIVFICKNKLGLNVSVDYILPHYANKDIILGLDEHDNPVDVEPILSAMPPASIKSINSNELQRIKWKIILAVPNIVNVMGHDGYIGNVHRKYRQLKTIGYTPIVIAEDKWNYLSQENEKENYLRQLIFEETSHNLSKT